MKKKIIYVPQDGFADELSVWLPVEVEVEEDEEINEEEKYESNDT